MALPQSTVPITSIGTPPSLPSVPSLVSPTEALYPQCEFVFYFQIRELPVSYMEHSAPLLTFADIQNLPKKIYGFIVSSHYYPSHDFITNAENIVLDAMADMNQYIEHDYLTMPHEQIYSFGYFPVRPQLQEKVQLVLKKWQEIFTIGLPHTTVFPVYDVAVYPGLCDYDILLSLKDKHKAIEEKELFSMELPFIAKIAKDKELYSQAQKI